MANEQSSINPSASTDTQAPSAAPVATKEHALPNDGEGQSNNQVRTAEDLAKEFRSAEKWIIGTNVALGIIGVLALCIYHGQLNVMRGQLGEIIKQYLELQKSANAADTSSRTASGALQEIKKGGTDTHNLALAAGNQAAALIQQLELQRRIARIDGGGARVEINSISLFHETGKVFDGVVVQNNGREQAEGVKVCSKIEFRKSAPPRIKCDNFQFVNPSPLPKGEIGRVPKAVEGEIPSDFGQNQQIIYIYGEIRYTDFTGEMVNDQFCKIANTQFVLNGPLETALTTAYHSLYLRS